MVVDNPASDTGTVDIGTLRANILDGVRGSATLQ